MPACAIQYGQQLHRRAKALAEARFDRYAQGPTTQYVNTLQRHLVGATGELLALGYFEACGYAVAPHFETHDQLADLSVTGVGIEVKAQQRGAFEKYRAQITADDEAKQRRGQIRSMREKNVGAVVWVEVNLDLWTGLIHGWATLGQLEAAPIVSTTGQGLCHQLDVLQDLDDLHEQLGRSVIRSTEYGTPAPSPAQHWGDVRAAERATDLLYGHAPDATFPLPTHYWRAYAELAQELHDTARAGLFDCDRGSEQFFRCADDVVDLQIQMHRLDFRVGLITKEQLDARIRDSANSLRGAGGDGAADEPERTAAAVTALALGDLGSGYSHGRGLLRVLRDRGRAEDRQDDGGDPQLGARG